MVKWGLSAPYLLSDIKIFDIIGMMELAGLNPFQAIMLIFVTF